MPAARDMFTRLVHDWLANPEAQSFPDDLLADDVVIEMPLAPPGWSSRIEGRQQFAALAEAGRRAMPLRFDNCRDVVVHETANAANIVVEYQLGGTVTTTGAPVTAPAIALLEVHDGRITRWREYQNIAALLQQPPLP
jgi:ketosteroid isomerase-like protein